MSVISEALVSLAEYKSTMGITGSGSDTEIEEQIDKVSMLIEGHCQRKFVNRTGLVEEILPDATAVPNISRDRIWMHLTWKTITGVTSIADQDTTPNTVASDQYRVLNSRGKLQYINGRWDAPVGWWTVTYDAGEFSNTAAVDEALKSAAIMWATERLARKNPSLLSKRVGDLALTFGRESAGRSAAGIDGVPSGVEAALAPYVVRRY